MSPTVRQRELGVRLRELRADLGLTVEDVAEKLRCSTVKISRLENGSRPPGRGDVRDLCALYKVDESVTADLMKLAAEARSPGWWEKYGDLDLNPYIELEQDATAITAYSMYHVHGLVQTEDYAKAMIQAIEPNMDPEIRRQRVEARMRRQELLDSQHSPRLRLLLDEAVLCRPVGSSAVMWGQLAKLLQLVSSGKLTVQIIPFELGVYSVADINFTLLEFETGQSSVIYVEGLSGGQYYERETDVARYRESIKCIQDTALNPRDSIQRLLDTQKTFAVD